MADFDTVQLRSLATDFQNKADFFNHAADLQDTGFKSDDVRIATEIQNYRDSITQEIIELQNRIVVLSQWIVDHGGDPNEI